MGPGAAVVGECPFIHHAEPTPDTAGGWRFSEPDDSAGDSASIAVGLIRQGEE